MQDADVIERLGHATKVAVDLTAISPEPVTDKAVQAWRLRNRIPGEWRPLVARLAAARIPDFSTEEFLMGARRRTYTRQRSAA